MLFLLKIKFGGKFMDFIQSIDVMGLLKCFIVGGVICIIGQLLIDKTKLTPARILVIFVSLGAILRRFAEYISTWLILQVLVLLFLLQALDII